NLSHRAFGDLRASPNRAVEERVGILDIDPHRNWRAAKGSRTRGAHHGVVEHDDRAADAQLGVHDLSVRTDCTRLLLSAERLLVPVDGRGGILSDEMRCDGVESLGNCLPRFRSFCLRLPKTSSFALLFDVAATSKLI